MEQVNANNENTILIDTINSAIKVPGVKVDRNKFLREIFSNESVSNVEKILEVGPIQAGYSRDTIKVLAKKQVDNWTIKSTGASFVAGLPGGLAMAATIPADTLQFFAVALRLAQEISYLYGAEDLWHGNELDTEKVTNQLILYYGVMFGASGASATVRVLSSALAKQALKQLPKQALTKTFYYPIIKSIAKAIGVKMTKGVFAKGISKAVPVIGGVVSGGITLATLRPMGNRLIDTLDEVHFAYSEQAFQADWQEISNTHYEEQNVQEKETAINQSSQNASPEQASKSASSSIEKIKEAKSLLDEGIITEEEFTEIKSQLIKQGI